MSNKQDNLDTKLSASDRAAGGLLSKQKQDMAASSAVEVAKTSSAKDIVLWLVAIALLIGATLVNQYLPGYWQPANNIWTRISIIVALIIAAIVCLAMTHQGRAFKILLKDAGIELRRVTWPSKDETFQYTWQVIVVIAIVGFVVWLLDNFFNWFVGVFIG